VHVLDDEQQRPAAALGEQPRLQGVERAALAAGGRLGAALGLRVRGDREQLVQQRSGLVDRQPAALELGVERGAPRLFVGLARHDALERGQQREQRRVLVVGRAPQPHRAMPGHPDALVQLVREPRLADPRLAADQHDAAVAR
jgi:hypothetical protein